MFQLNAFAISGLFIIVTYLPLFLFILIKGKTKVSKIFSLHLFAVFIWGVGSFLIGLNKNPEIADKIMIFAISGVLFIPVFFYHAVLELIQRRPKIILLLIYSQAIYFFINYLQGNMWTGMVYMFDSFFIFQGGTLLIYRIYFTIWTMLVITAHIELICYYKRCYPKERKQVMALILASIGYLGGLTNFLPYCGIEIYPYGNFFVPAHSLIITYTLLKYELFNIKIVIRRGMIYYVLLLLVSSLYLIIVLFSEKILQGFLGYRSVSSTVIAAFIIGILFFPLRSKIQKIVDKIFFEKSPEEILQENLLLKREISQVEKMKSIALLASGMAHEVKNPLTPIRTFLEYLPHKSNDKEFIKKFGGLARASVDRIDELINELLKFAKPAPLNLVSTDINKLISLNLELLSNEFIKHNIRVVKKFTGGIWLNVDQNQVRQALLNILLNAIDFMPNGGTITVETIKNENLCQISIKDTGPGIAKKDLLHIFDPFFSKKDTGTGLGLSITRGIITEHGGIIRAESNPGDGATFIITLPIKI